MERSALGLVLQLSRWFGIAPYVRNPDYQVSRAIDICGKIVYTCANAYAVIATIIIIFLYTDNTLLTIDIIHSGSRILMATIAVIGIYTASERIGRISRSLKQLNEIDINISCQRKTPGDRKMYIVVVTLFTVTIVIRILCICFYVGNFIFLQWIRVLVYQTSTLLEIQIVAFAGRVLMTLEMVNQSLEQLIPEEHSPVALGTKDTKPRIAWEDTGTFQINTIFNRISNGNRKTVENKWNNAPRATNDENTIRMLAKYYLNICQIVRATTKADGYLIMLMLVGHMLHLEISWHKIVIWLSDARSIPYYITTPLIIRSAIQSTSLFLCTEIFHQTHAQMGRTHKIVNYLKCRRGDEKEVNNELELFVRLLLLNKTTYSPLSMCTLSRPLVVKIIGCLVTYLVIILTYGPETSAPSLAFSNKETIL